MRVTYKRLFLKKRYPLAISRGVITGSENLFVCVEAFGRTGVGELASTTTEQGENCDTGLAELEPFVAALPDSPSIAQVWSDARERGMMRAREFFSRWSGTFSRSSTR